MHHEDTVNNVTIVESATRNWLSASVMVACILLGVFALDIRSSRQTVVDFPTTFNVTCHNGLDYVQNGIVESLTDLIEDVQNITNTEYQEAVGIARIVIPNIVNISVEAVLRILKSVDPLVYCGVETGISFYDQVVTDLKNAIDSEPQFSCGSGVPQDLCDDLNSIYSGIENIVGSIPYFPPDLTDFFQTQLGYSGLDDLVNALADFDAPPILLNFSSEVIVIQAISNSTSFNNARQSCSTVSASFTKATNETALILYYVEIAIWVAIALFLIGIFLYAIIKQFPTVASAWISMKFELVTLAVEQKMAQGGPGSKRSYFVWLLKYINFRMALLTTCYGALGLIVAFGLVPLTKQARAEVDVWVYNSLSPAFGELQMEVQKGIDEALAELTIILNAPFVALRNSGSLGNIQYVENLMDESFQGIMGDYNSMLTTIGATPVVGQPIVTALNCFLPVNDITYLEDAFNVVADFIQVIYSIQVKIPRFTFPNLAVFATQACNITLTILVEDISSSLARYQVIFILLTIAVGILIFQGVLIIGFQTMVEKIKQKYSHSQTTVQMQTVQVTTI